MMNKHVLSLVLLGICASVSAQNVKARKADGTACAQLPCVVASVTAIDQSAAVASTVLFTPDEDGLFRVTYYLESAHVKGSTWGVGFGWTDDVKARNTGVFQAHGGS